MNSNSESCIYYTKKYLDIKGHRIKNSRAKLPLSGVFLPPFAHGFALELWANPVIFLKNKKSIKTTKPPIYGGFKDLYSLKEYQLFVAFCIVQVMRPKILSLHIACFFLYIVSSLLYAGTAIFLPFNLPLSWSVFSRHCYLRLLPYSLSLGLLHAYSI